jgi:hypothetical protein
VHTCEYPWESEVQNVLSSALFQSLCEQLKCFLYASLSNKLHPQKLSVQMDVADLYLLPEMHDHFQVVLSITVLS